MHLQGQLGPKESLQKKGQGLGSLAYSTWNICLKKTIDEEPDRNVTPLHTHQWKEGKTAGK